MPVKRKMTDLEFWRSLAMAFCAGFIVVIVLAVFAFGEKSVQLLDCQYDLGDNSVDFMMTALDDCSRKLEECCWKEKPSSSRECVEWDAMGKKLIEEGIITIKIKDLLLPSLNERIIIDPVYNWNPEEHCLCHRGEECDVE